MSMRSTLSRFAAIVAVLLVAGCAESPSSPLQPDDSHARLLGSDLRLVSQLLPISSTVSHETIGPEGGTLKIPGGHSLHFPPGALARPTTITAVRDPLRLMVDFGPEGLVFPDAARPTLTYSYGNSGLLGLLAPATLTVVYLDGLRLLEVLPTEVDPAARVVRAELKHFSTYALATD